MKVLKAIQIAEREWENIRNSLEGCGDVGGFASESYVNGYSVTPINEDLPLITNLIQMNNKFPKYGYFTPEAAYVFARLASRAAEGLKLKGKLARTFGSGYGLIRTGCLDLYDVEEPEHHVIKQLFFFKLFFPLGAFFTWDFSSPTAKTKLKLVFNTFTSWQHEPESYIRDVRDYRSQLKPLLISLSSGLSLFAAGTGEGLKNAGQGTGINTDSQIHE